MEKGSGKVCDAITLVNIFLRHLGINPQTHPYSGKGDKCPAYDSCGQFCKWSMWLPLFLSLELVIFSYYHNKIADQSNLGKEGRVQADSHFKSTVYHGAENEASDHISSTVGEIERSEWMLVFSSFT